MASNESYKITKDDVFDNVAKDPVFIYLDVQVDPVGRVGQVVLNLHCQHTALKQKHKNIILSNEQYSGL